MIRAHQPGSQPIDIPEVIPNPAVVPKQEPAPREPAPKEPVKVPEKVPAREQRAGNKASVEVVLDGALVDGDAVAPAHMRAGSVANSRVRFF
jgi:hypothetical protein